MRDVVVCIPGITGSVLRKDGRDVWNISGGAVINALRSLGGSIGDLKLEDDPLDVDDLGDGITAPSVIRDVHLIPGLWKIDGYTKMLRYIEETFDVTRGREPLRVPVRLAARQPRRGAAAAATRPRDWLSAGASRAARRREARARRPLDGRARRPLLPRVPRRLARHADAGHLRDARTAARCTRSTRSSTARRSSSST